MIKPFIDLYLKKVMMILSHQMLETIQEKLLQLSLFSCFIASPRASVGFEDKLITLQTNLGRTSQSKLLCCNHNDRAKHKHVALTTTGYLVSPKRQFHTRGGRHQHQSSKSWEGLYSLCASEGKNKN